MGGDDGRRRHCNSTLSYSSNSAAGHCDAVQYSDTAASEAALMQILPFAWHPFGTGNNHQAVQLLPGCHLHYGINPWAKAAEPCVDTGEGPLSTGR